MRVYLRLPDELSQVQLCSRRTDRMSFPLDVPEFTIQYTVYSPLRTDLNVKGEIRPGIAYLSCHRIHHPSHPFFSSSLCQSVILFVLWKCQPCSNLSLTQWETLPLFASTGSQSMKVSSAISVSVVVRQHTVGSPKHKGHLLSGEARVHFGRRFSER